MRSAIGPVVLLLATSSGCHYDAIAVDSDDGGTAPGADASAEAYCDWVIRCTAERGPLFADREACERGREDFQDCVFAELAVIHDLGAIAWHDVNAAGRARCDELLATYPCDPGLPVPTCGGINAPPGPLGREGDACGGGVHCEYPLQCDDPEDLCGTCVPRAQEGEDCSLGACAAGLVCDPSSTVCVPLAPAGALCANAFGCISAQCVSGVCVDPIPFGGACVPDVACAGWLSCIGGVCSERRPGGAACEDDDDCYFDHWCLAGVCTFHEWCGSAAVGDRCTGGALGGCTDGAWCEVPDVTSFEDRICREVLPLGAPCTGGIGECGPDAYCSGSQCTPIEAPGAPCLFDFQCQLELTCGPFGTCAPYGATGDPCTNHGHCESRFCDDAAGVCSDSPICG